MVTIFEHWFGWFVLTLIISGSVYIMLQVGQEKSDFIEECYFVQFFDLELPIPQWWTLTKQTQHELIFERTDTSYSWKATYTYYSDNTTPLVQLLEKKMIKDDIQYDKPDIIIDTESKHLIQSPEVYERFVEFIRVEGQATEKINDRIYLDLVMARDKNQPGYFVFESKSSVLNGLIEGPYFEESLKLMKTTSRA